LFASGSLAIGDVLRGDLPTGVGQYEYMKIQGIDTSLNKITVRRDIYNGWPGTLTGILITLQIMYFEK
jgi:hypothetical protein